MRAEWEAALRGGDLEQVELLLGEGADVDALDRFGQSGLMLAATQGHAEVVAILIAHGAHLDHTAKYGLSALMLAVLRGDHSIVRALVEAGADQSARGTGAPGFAGKTAADLARDRNDQACIDILQAPPAT